VQCSIGAAVFFSALFGVHLGAEENPTEPLVPIEVQLIDGDGKPVDGAEVGTSADIGYGEAFLAQTAGSGTQWRYANHLRSAADGIARLSADPRNPGAWSSLIARHEGRKIAAIASVDQRKQDQPIRITLLPEREIVGEAGCPEVSSEAFGGITVSIGQPDTMKPIIQWRLKEAKFRISLPPGTYGLGVESTRAYRSKQHLVVAPGADDQRIEPIVLRAVEWAALVGKPAPELPDVLAWKNSAPVKLADLRGKVVVLDFWGYWCGPCVAGMPKLFELYDKHHGEGLEVIGVHEAFAGAGDEALVDTVAKLDTRLTETRNELWQGRDLPFPVALVLGNLDAPEKGYSVRSPASACYGIVGYPTYILIDRRGNLVGTFHPNEEGIAQLEKTLAEK
jgi:thiol-disulfide isomerase/thioredoxin